MTSMRNRLRGSRMSALAVVTVFEARIGQRLLGECQFGAIATVCGLLLQENPSKVRPDNFDAVMSARAHNWAHNH